MARVLTCIDPVPASDGSCAEAVYLEQPSFLPPMTVQDARDISTAVLTALVAVMAVKVAFRKSQ